MTVAMTLPESPDDSGGTGRLVPSIFLFKNRACFVGNRNRLFVPVIASLCLAFFVMAAVTAAMYLPVFQLGATVQ